MTPNSLVKVFVPIDVIDVCFLCSLACLVRFGKLFRDCNHKLSACSVASHGVNARCNTRSIDVIKLLCDCDG